MAVPIKIDFVSDISCPWCVIGLKALEQALDNLGDTVRAKAVVVAAGAGAFGPNRPPLDGLPEFVRAGAREMTRGDETETAVGPGDHCHETVLRDHVRELPTRHGRARAPRCRGAKRTGERSAGTEGDPNHIRHAVRMPTGFDAGYTSPDELADPARRPAGPPR